jgi:hypothetical protein
MDIKDVAKTYLKYLEAGDMVQVIALFSSDGQVDSPLYGIKRAEDFYQELDRDTSASKLVFRGLFEKEDSKALALYFTYIWRMKNQQKVEFDVVDILEFDAHNRIQNLKIIYDTVQTRALMDQLNG